MPRPINKILFIEPKNPRPHIFSRVSIPRLGSVLLGTILQQQGYEVKVIVEEIQGVDLEQLDFAPDLVCLSTITPTTPRAFELAGFYRRRGLPVVMGGAHPSFTATECLEHADYVICGEGDEALPELVAHLNGDGRALREIGNLCYWENGQQRQNPWRPFLADLDQLPIPNFNLIHGWRPGQQKIVSIATSRGCPYGCRFCSVILLFGRQFRYHSIARVLAEIRQNAAQASHVFFCDDNFTADRRRAKELLRRMIAEGLTPEWSAQVRVDAVKDPELLDLMARSGCYMVFIGLESINPETLKAYKKGQTVAEIQESVEKFHDYGIKVHGMFVFGAETDNVQVIRDTIKFSHAIDLDSLQYLILTPIPGTPVYDELLAENRILHHDWQYYDGHHAVFQPRQMTPYELQVETMRAMKKFYTWPSVLKRLWRRDWFFAMLKAHGRLHLGRSYKELRQGYFQQLRQQLLDQVHQWRRLLPRRRPKKVGIPEDIWRVGAWEAGPRDFLLKFLEKLGVEIVREEAAEAAPGTGESGNQLRTLVAEVAKLRQKTDVILLPLWQSWENAKQRGKEKQEELSRLLTGYREALTLKFSPGSFYNECIRLGLLFRSRLGLIRLAYFQTLREIGLSI